MRVCRDVIRRVQSLLERWFQHLLPLWEEVSVLEETMGMILGTWNELLDLVAKGETCKPTTKTASALTLQRMSTWEGRLRRWMESRSIIPHAVYHNDEREGTHCLSCIANLIDEVSQ